MSVSANTTVSISKTDDGRWRVVIKDTRGKIIDSHELDEKPTPESVQTLMAEADEHHDALVRLVDR